jgi:hypothetical protein
VEPARVSSPQVDLTRERHIPIFHARATECVHGGGSCSRLRLSLQADARCFLQMFGLVQHFTELTTGKHEWTEVGNKSVSSRAEPKLSLCLCQHGGQGRTGRGACHQVVLADFNLPSYSPLLQGIYITVHSTPADESTVISKVDAFEKNLFASDKTAATASN